MRKRLARDRPLEERAERRPAFAQVVDEQPLRRHGVDDVAVVYRVNGARVSLVVGSAGEHTVQDELVRDVVDRAQRRVVRRRKARGSLDDRGAEARVPGGRIAHGQHDACGGKGARELAPERRGRPIDGGGVAAEERVPVDGLAARRAAPDLRVLGLPRDLDHVVARGEPERLERTLQRQRASAAEPGADNRERHRRRRLARRLGVTSERPRSAWPDPP